MSSAQPRRPRWRFRLQRSETAWAIAFVVPYAAVFAAFVAYPVVFGLWMAPLAAALLLAGVVGATVESRHGGEVESSSH